MALRTTPHGSWIQFALCGRISKSSNLSGVGPSYLFSFKVAADELLRKDTDTSNGGEMEMRDCAATLALAVSAVYSLIKEGWHVTTDPELLYIMKKFRFIY